MGCLVELAINFVQSFSLRDVPIEFPTILATIIHTCHVGFHADFSSTKIVMGCDPKLLLCKAKARTYDTLKQSKVKDSKEP